ncbi:MAG: hypothetical protein AAFX87_08575 [Bacteroidota bacterium]
MIPCFNEPDLINSLISLRNCEVTKANVEVIVIINNSDNADTAIKSRNAETFETAKEWAVLNNKDRLKFHIIYENDLPAKHAGVGLARKIGMDEAVRRLAVHSNDNGIIICFDADCECDANFLVAIEDHFRRHPSTPGCSICFEHPISTDLPLVQSNAILDYELFLRYYILAQKAIQVPYAFHTVGSSMAVRSSAYQKQGGMNRKKAGEDFYFLHKIISLSQFTSLNSTRVIPSPRVSDRVPFGTGKAIGDYLHEKHITAYAQQTFEDLAVLINARYSFYKQPLTVVNSNITQLPTSIRSFLNSNNFAESVDSINNNCSSPDSFNTKFFEWLNAFRLLKFVHFARDNYYPNIPLMDGVAWAMEKFGLSNEKSTPRMEALKKLRKLERSF